MRKVIEEELEEFEKDNGLDFIIPVIEKNFDSIEIKIKSWQNFKKNLLNLLGSEKEVGSEDCISSSAVKPHTVPSEKSGSFDGTFTKVPKKNLIERLGG